MRKIRRIIHKQVGGVGNFFAIILIVAITVILINTSVLSKRHPRHIAPPATLQTNVVFPNQNQTSSTNVLPSFVEPQRLRRPLVVDEGCEIEEKCSEDSIPYKVVSGEGLDRYPLICFNNRLLMHKNLKDSKVGRGLNVIALDGRTFEMKISDTFDTYLEESFLIRSLRLGLHDGDIIIVASYDEMSYGLKDSSRGLLEKYGSQLVKTIKFRDSFVMIGQKGLSRGKAIEMHQTKGNRDFASAAHVSGCAKFPLGTITPFPSPTAEVNQEGKIAVGTMVRNCGLPHSCKTNEFAVHVYTGKDNNDEPKICVDGKYVIARGINDAGRGLNLVVVANGREVIRTGHFDTWQDDSTNLEIFLENLEENVIVIAVTFDEASLKLSQHSKNLFFDLGSATIQNLKYRDVWVLVGQKGIKGFSPYEEISYAGSGSTYAPPINKKMCVPQTLKGNMIRPDPLPFRNDKRRDFCSRYDGYGDFCNDLNVDKALQAVPLVNKTLEDNPIYSTPILIVAGMSHNSLRMCLETLMMQPGINTDTVLVAVDEKFSEPLALIDLFKFRGIKTSNASTYMEHYKVALAQVWEIFPDKNQVIVIEEDLILSPDFLYTLALLYETFRKDETIGAVQMWNPNSFEIVNGSIELIYRVDEFFGLGFLLKRSIYEQNLKHSFDLCCAKRVWERWTFPSKYSFLMPDVSRTFRKPIDGNQENSKFIDALFNRKRRTNLNPFPPLSNIDVLRKDRYDADLKRSISSATIIKSLPKCSTINSNLFNQIDNQNSSTSFKFVFEQTSVNDVSELTAYLPCFGLFPTEPLGFYRGVLRFYANKYEFYLVGMKSPFYAML